MITDHNQLLIHHEHRSLNKVNEATGKSYYMESRK